MFRMPWASADLGSDAHRAIPAPSTGAVRVRRGGVALRLRNHARRAGQRLANGEPAGQDGSAGERVAVRLALPDPAFRRNAERIQREIHASPSPNDVVDVLENLARGCTRGTRVWTANQASPEKTRLSRTT